jgi:hypothetical protein
MPSISWNFLTCFSSWNTWIQVYSWYFVPFPFTVIKVTRDPYDRFSWISMYLFQVEVYTCFWAQEQVLHQITTTKGTRHNHLFQAHLRGWQMPSRFFKFNQLLLSSSLKGLHSSHDAFRPSMHTYHRVERNALSRHNTPLGPSQWKHIACIHWPTNNYYNMYS